MNYSQQLLLKLFSSCLNIHIFKEQIPSETNLLKEFHFQTFSSISVDFYIVSLLKDFYYLYLYKLFLYSAQTTSDGPVITTLPCSSQTALLQISSICLIL